MVGGNATTTPDATNGDAMERWTLNIKAEFVLNRSISHDHFEHIIH
ncbi:unnamed protein product [Musa acuminata subsp. malaccensis]|uniref:(wild Malaysian banana) hypothetical protein n=1 Tax=Musa acuminata subsp. malaccensis TaxID=214687 RepID=A0A8D6ZLW4_MUSAM|nr:unnamed protein product [Musa acuminata subsp. malaccensis]